jgi:hypothetical protein
LLLTEPLDELTKNTEWTRICGEKHSLDLSVLSFLASMIETRRPGTIPRNVLSQLSRNIDDNVLRPEVVPLLQQHMEHADRLMALVEKWKGEDQLPQHLLTVAKVNEFIHETSERGMSAISESSIDRLEKDLHVECARLEDLIKYGIAA